MGPQQLRVRTRSAPPTPGKMVAQLCSRRRSRTQGTPDVEAACGIAACEVIQWDARVPTALVNLPWDDERQSAKLARELARFTASPDSVHRCREGQGGLKKCATVLFGVAVHGPTKRSWHGPPRVV